jgi:hypothetical protein
MDELTCVFLMDYSNAFPVHMRCRANYWLNSGVEKTGKQLGLNTFGGQLVENKLVVGVLPTPGEDDWTTNEMTSVVESITKRSSFILKHIGGHNAIFQYANKNKLYTFVLVFFCLVVGKQKSTRIVNLFDNSYYASKNQRHIKLFIHKFRYFKQKDKRAFVRQKNMNLKDR